MTKTTTSAPPLTVKVENLAKSYSGVKAVDNISFEVRQGEIFGLLGPNGAGKTTTLSILQGLLASDSGRASVLGLDVATQTPQVKRRIGVQLQSTSLLSDLSAVEQVKLFARLYGRQMNRSTALALLGQVELADKADSLPEQMSGGQQQRLALALALVNDPEVLFLDEPTAGLDPQSRRRLWEVVEQLREQGRTVILTTHYMEEAEVLCHRVGIMDRGKLLAVATPGDLINQLNGRSSITTAAALPHDSLRALPAVQALHTDGALIRLQSSDVATTISSMQELARAHGTSLRDLHVQQPSLEEVFLTLTGRSFSS